MLPLRVWGLLVRLGQPRSLQSSDRVRLLLVQGDRKEKDRFHAIRMLPSRDHGGASIAMGEALPILWSQVELEGISALEKVADLPVPETTNLDFAPGEGKSRGRRTLFLVCTEKSICISHFYASKNSPKRARPLKQMELARSVAGVQLEEAIREMFKAW